jgi:hypothetical protein
MRLIKINGFATIPPLTRKYPERKNTVTKRYGKLTKSKTTKTMNTKRHPRILILALLLGGAWALSGCADSTSTPTSKNNMNFNTSLGTSTVKSTGTTGKFEPESHGARVDSLRVTYVGMIVSGLKMHMIGGVDDTSSAKGSNDVLKHDKGNGKSKDGKHWRKHHDHDDDDDDIIVVHLDDHHEGTVITGPFLLEFDSSGTQLVTRAEIPAGIYDRIKFEIHKLRGEANDPWLNDSVMVNFISNDATIILKGYVWDNGVMYPFTYYSRVTANLNVHFDPAIVIENDIPANVALTFEPGMVFSAPFSFGRPIDPRDPDNRKHIEEAIKLAFKLAKKLS